MMEGAMDDDDDDRRPGAAASESESDEEAKETADEKRLRLAKSYLDKLRAEEAEAATDEDEDDEDNLRNMDSGRLANRLKSEAMHRTGRVRREIAHRLVAPSPTGRTTRRTPTKNGRAGTVWRGHRLSVTGLALTVDDTTVYSVSKEGGIVRWDVETGAKTKYPRTPTVVVDPAKGGGDPWRRCDAARRVCCAARWRRTATCCAPPGRISACTCGTLAR